MLLTSKIFLGNIGKPIGHAILCFNFHGNLTMTRTTSILRLVVGKLLANRSISL